TAPISGEAYLRMKWDRAYDQDAALYRDVVRPVLAARASLTGAAEREALDLLAAWDGRTNEDEPGATIAILTWRGVNPTAAGAGKALLASDAVDAFLAAVQSIVT